MYNNNNQRKIKDMSQLFKNKAFLFIITLLLFTSAAFAEDPGGIEGGDAGEPAPISDWIPLMVVVGIALAFYYTRKRKQVQQ
jgi:hypothetical protein